MFNKRNKKRGFTLIELIIVIAIIAILAVIAVPAFGKIREKANVSADLGNARTIYSLVATELASDTIQYANGIENQELDNVGGVNIKSKIDPAPQVKTYQKAEYVVSIDEDGNIQVSITGGTADGTIGVYPKSEGKYAKTSSSNNNGSGNNGSGDNGLGE